MLVQASSRKTYLQVSAKLVVWPIIQSALEASKCRRATAPVMALERQASNRCCSKHKAAKENFSLHLPTVSIPTVAASCISLVGTALRMGRWFASDIAFWIRGCLCENPGPQVNKNDSDDSDAVVKALLPKDPKPFAVAGDEG